MSNYFLWTIEETEKLKQYSGKMSFHKMKELYFPNRTAISLQKKAIKLKLISNFRKKKHIFNQEFYHQPNLVNSYFAGNFAADGYLKYRGNSTMYVLQVNSKDLELLESFKKACDFSGPIRSYQRKNYKKETLKNVSSLIMTGVNPWRESLEKNFGIVENKTLRMSPPNIISQELKMAYIIGYLDGDGSILLRPKENRLSIRFYSCNLKIMEWILFELNNFLKLKNILNKANLQKNKNLFCMEITNLRAAIIIYYLKDFPVPKLSRKWSNPLVLQCIEDYKQKYPEFFLDKPIIT